MPISRREFISSGAATGAGIALARFMSSSAALADTDTGSAAAPQGMWPIAPRFREVHSFDQGWQFARADGSVAGLPSAAGIADLTPVDDKGWEQVTLPHSVRLEPLSAGGGQNFQGICWYQRRFTASPDWRGKVVQLTFEAAMSVADVWLNGHHLTTHYGGYLPFVLDLSHLLQFGSENTLTVRLNNQDNPEVPPGKPQGDLDFVYFGGLYRSVRLEVSHPVHISNPMLANKPAGGGIFVTYPEVAKDRATVAVQVDVANASAATRHATVRLELWDATGAAVATVEHEAEIEAGNSHAIAQTIAVKQPKLWHPQQPHLYLLHTTVLEKGVPVDDQYTRIGIRTFRFDREQGLILNGEKFFSLGANRHQDHPYVGYALPASAHFRDAWKLRDAGFTSYRCHYPQHPAFMDACDELGILGIVSNPGWQFNGDAVFRDRVYQDAREMVRRDRNHACVVLWEPQLNESDNKNIAAELYRIVHEEYPGPDCYAAGDRIGAPVAGFTAWDVEYSHNDGSRPLWIREWGDQVDNWSDQQGSARVDREWGETPMLVQAARHLTTLDGIYADLTAPLVAGKARAAGADLWAGIDYYRGYHHQAFYGSPLDLFRLPKFDYFLFQSQRPAARDASAYGSGPMVFVANFATFQSPTTVMVFSNCEQVRLTQNGKLIAVQQPDTGYHLPHPPFTFRLAQFSQLHTMLFATGVAAPGTPIGNVKAEGLIGGVVVATHELEAPGVPAGLRLEADTCGRTLTADGSDWVRLYAHVCDARGTTYPYSADQVSFRVEGEGTIIGAGESEATRLLANPMRAQAGIATVLLRSTPRPGAIKIEASSPGLKPAVLELASASA